LARATARTREAAIRTALGARAWRVALPFATEAFVLSLLGAVPGVGIAVLTALIFGAAPAWRSSSCDVARALHSGGRVAVRSRLRSALVVSQVALAALLLAMSGLFIETLRRVGRVDPGFVTERLLVASFDLHLQGYDPPRSAVFARGLLERVRALPGVEGAGLAATVPLGTSFDTWMMRIEGVEVAPESPGTAIAVNWASDGYFETMGIPLLRGRAFDERDGRSTAATAIVNETFARRYWPDRSPVGRTLSTGRPDEPAIFEVVGVVADLTYVSLGDAPRPYVYLPHATSPVGGSVLHVRTADDPYAVLPAVRRAVAELDPGLPLYDVTSIENVVHQSLWQERLLASMLGLFAGLALALGATGVYGVVAYAVSQRTREVGIRMALGADANRVRLLFLGHSAALLAAGLVVGLAAAVGLGHAVRGMLYDVGPTDPAVLLGTCLVLGLAALAAAGLPARRATRVDPVAVLREE
ncbi:MAG: FtsX-like permease family protein, partial [Thermoanaerobaculia bacterium]|nr:FtsX-like permease family protein [Thermoanaerobaculia bacterium]